MLACRGDYAYGELGLPPKVPKGGVTLVFEIECLGWKEQRKERFDLSCAERLAEADRVKAAGTDLFRCARYAEALERYLDGVWYLDDEEDDFEAPEGSEAAVGQLRTACWLNGANCCLKLGRDESDYEQAIELCDRALARDEASAKALFRRGSAKMELTNYTDAKADLRRACALEPKSRELRDALAECANRAFAAKAAEKESYRKMLGAPKKFLGPTPEKPPPKEVEWDFSI